MYVAHTFTLHLYVLFECLTKMFLFFTVSGVLTEESEALYHLALNLEKNAIIVLDKNATKIYMRDFNLRRKVLWVSILFKMFWGSQAGV